MKERSTPDKKGTALERIVAITQGSFRYLRIGADAIKFHPEKMIEPITIRSGVETPNSRLIYVKATGSIILNPDHRRSEYQFPIRQTVVETALNRVLLFLQITQALL